MREFISEYGFEYAEYPELDEANFEDTANAFQAVLDDILSLHPQYAGFEVQVAGFGWRNLDGRMLTHELDAAELLREILPNTPCAFKVYQNGDTIEIQNFHHDSPMGNEWYTISAVPKCACCGELLSTEELLHYSVLVREHDGTNQEVCERCGGMYYEDSEKIYF